MGQVPKRQDPTIPKMELNSVILLVPPCLVNSHIIQTDAASLLAFYLKSVVSKLPADYSDDITITSSDSPRATEDRQLFSQAE